MGDLSLEKVLENNDSIYVDTNIIFRPLSLICDKLEDNPNFDLEEFDFELAFEFYQVLLSYKDKLSSSYDIILELGGLSDRFSSKILPQFCNSSLEMRKKLTLLHGVYVAIKLNLKASRHKSPLENIPKGLENDFRLLDLYRKNVFLGHQACLLTGDFDFIALRNKEFHPAEKNQLPIYMPQYQRDSMPFFYTLR